MSHKTHRRTPKQQPDLKMPKRGTTTANQIEQRLKSKSPWFISIEHPKTGADCKIPDETGEETGTLQSIKRVSQTVGTGGVCGVRTITLYPNTCNVNAASSPTGCNYQIVDPASPGTGDIIFGHINGSSVFQAGGGEPFQSNTALQGNARGVRIVSASMGAMSEASDLDNKGELIGWATPFDTYKQNAIGTGLNGTTVSAYKNAYGSAFVPLNTKQGMTTRWFPYARAPLTYKEFVDPTHSIVGFGGGHTSGVAPSWELGCLVVGATPGTTVEFEIVVNYEFLPLQNSINIVQAKPSPADADESNMVLNWIQDEPLARPVNEKYLGTAPGTVSPTHDDKADSNGGFGFALDVLTELAPIALGLLSLA